MQFRCFLEKIKNTTVLCTKKRRFRALFGFVLLFIPYEIIVQFFGGEVELG